MAVAGGAFFLNSIHSALHTHHYGAQTVRPQFRKPTPAKKPKPRKPNRKPKEPIPADYDPLTSKELLAKELGVNLTTLRRWENEGVLPKGIRLGRRVGWPRSVIRKWKLSVGWPEESVNAADAA